jgi:gp16 family phage-associated protein
MVQMSAQLIDHARLSEVRQVFIEDGVSVAEWAREHNFSLPLVYAVLNGRNHATRGKSHKIAVALGLKKTTNRLALIGANEVPAPNEIRAQKVTHDSAKEHHND